MFSILFFINKLIQKSVYHLVLTQVCAASMVSKAFILMSLNSKLKSLFQQATTELFQKETRIGKQQENGKSACGSDALD